MRPLHRVTIGRTREVRGPDSLERAIVGIIIAVAMTLAVGFGVHQMRMADAAEAVTLARGIEYDEVVARAVHGNWLSPPAAAGIARGTKGRYVRKTTVGGDGVITMQLMLDTHAWGVATRAEDRHAPIAGLLSFRPQLIGAPGYEGVTFACGYAKPPGRATSPRGDNHTTLQRRDLPPACR